MVQSVGCKNTIMFCMFRSGDCKLLYADLTGFRNLSGLYMKNFLFLEVVAQYAEFRSPVEHFGNFLLFGRKLHDKRFV